MSGFAEISEALQATCGETPALQSRVERVRASADSLADQADSHGWTGVAGSMRGAVDALATGLVELAEFQRASEAALTQLDSIDDQGSVVQVSVHLVGAQEELAVAVQRLDAVTGLVDAALQACAQAGQRGLPIPLSAVRDDVIETRGRLEQSRNACDAERRAVEAWLQENPDHPTNSSESGAESTPQLADRSTPSATEGTVAREGDETRNDAPGFRNAPASQQRQADETGAVARAPTKFDKLIDPSGQTKMPRGSRPSSTFFTSEEFERRAEEAPAPRKHSRASRRLMAAGTLALVATEATVGSALDLGSALGQAVGGLFFGTVLTIIGIPEFKKVVRETKPKHKARLTAKERARGQD
jgi:hypothetical protein